MRRHRRTAKEALRNAVDAQAALGTLTTQLEYAVADRNAAQEVAQAAHVQMRQAGQ